MFLHMLILREKNLYGIIFSHGENYLLKFILKIYPQNIVVVVQYNILKICIMHFSKIKLSNLFILYCSFINKCERD